MSQANFQTITTTRRALLGSSAALAVAAAVSGTAVTAAVASRSELNALYEERTALIVRSRDLRRRHVERSAALPWWAAPGPKYVRGDGSWQGPSVEWPAIDNGKLPDQPHYMSNKRPTLFDIRKDRDILLQWHPEAHRPAVRAGYRRRMRDLVARLRRQRDEMQKAGLLELENEIDAVGEQIGEIEARLENLVVGAADAAQKAAALVMIAASYERGGDDEFGCRASLNALRPLLTGQVREHAEYVVANPDCEMSNMPSGLAI